MPRIERLHQNTPEWHRWRRQGIGASDAPVIMGETAFKTPRTLWSIKTGRMQEGPAGPAARRGRELERLARRAYERQTGIQVEPLCLVHEGFEWMRASLDGLSFDGSTLLEIKCPLSLRDRASADLGAATLEVEALVSTTGGSSAGRASGFAVSICNACCLRPPPPCFFKSRLGPPFCPFPFLSFSDASSSTSSSMFSVAGRCSTSIGFVSPLSNN